IGSGRLWHLSRQAYDEPHRVSDSGPSRACVRQCVPARLSMWNRLRYSFWAPAYDAIAGAAGFDEARRVSIARLGLAPGQRLLIVGAGTGLDLPHVPPDVDVTAIDVTPAMLRRLARRAEALGRRVTTHVMDARRLSFPDAS